MDGFATEIERDAAGRFVPGQSGNPAGKKPGIRNRKSVMLEALRDGEGEAACRVVIDKATAGDAVAARFVVALISPKPRGRTIQLEMPEDDEFNVVTAFNVTLRALCQGEITPDEALTVSRFLDGRRRALQAWQLEEKLTAGGRTIPGDPEWAPEPDAPDDAADEDADGEVLELTEIEAAFIRRARLVRAAEEGEIAPSRTADMAQTGAARLQTPCIYRLPGSDLGPLAGSGGRDSALAAGATPRPDGGVPAP